MKQRLTNESKTQGETQSAHAAKRGMEFGSVEDALRFDAAQTPVPPALRARVLGAVEVEMARRPWWRRWFRR